MISSWSRCDRIGASTELGCIGRVIMGKFAEDHVVAISAANPPRVNNCSSCPYNS